MRAGFFGFGLLLGTALPLIVLAADAETQQDRVIACLSKMETETTWDQCRTELFSPCAKEVVGAEPHLTCLRAEKSEWRAHLDGQTDVLLKKLTVDGTVQLTEILGQWFGYVGQKCTQVAAQKANISEDAALLGCEVSEIAGLATEMQSCLSGKSVSPYCTFKE